MRFLIRFLKGILVGIGGIAPGLSGSVMMLLLGLYERAVQAIAAPFRNFKENVFFLVPLVLGGGCGILLFSKLVDFMLAEYEFATRYLFLGLVLGTVPLFYKEVKKKGFSKGFYGVILAALGVGLVLFSFHSNLFSRVTEPDLLQSILLGVAVAGSSIVPGVDSAVILSAFGLYELYVSSVANLQWAVLLPAGVGLVTGAILISALMHVLIQRCYTATFSVIFGLFLSILPRVLTPACTWHSFGDGIGAVVLVLFGFAVSLYLSNVHACNARIREWYQKRKRGEQHE